MNEYSIHVESGKVIGDSAFFLIANDLLGKECKRLCDFTDSLDKSPLLKKENIAEYKCAKYRYAGITNVWAMLYMNHRVGKRNYQTNHLAPKFNEIFVTFPCYVEIYNQAPNDEKTDFALYYGALAFADFKIAELKSNILSAGDWAFPGGTGCPTPGPAVPHR